MRLQVQFEPVNWFLWGKKFSHSKCSLIWNQVAFAQSDLKELTRIQLIYKQNWIFAINKNGKICAEWDTSTGYDYDWFDLLQFMVNLLFHRCDINWYPLSVCNSQFCVANEGKAIAASRWLWIFLSWLCEFVLSSPIHNHIFVASSNWMFAISRLLNCILLLTANDIATIYHPGVRG